MIDEQQYAILRRLADGDSLVAFRASGVEWSTGLGNDGGDHPDFDVLESLHRISLVSVAHKGIIFMNVITDLGRQAVIEFEGAR